MARFSFRPPPVWLVALLLMAGLLLALLVNNRQYLFHTDLFEFEDLSVNSLQIARAKGFHELYGQYSRWGFRHPGPAFFYVQALGEWLFYDRLHLVPRPLNAQMLATLVLNTFFLAIALAVAARQVGGRTVFLPLALILGVLHFAAIQHTWYPLGTLLLLGNWPGYFLVVPFVAFLVLTASVAAGRGQSLPMAALAGCFLVHGHITQPVLFVLPFSALAYLGLLFACRRTNGTPPDAPAPGWRAALTRPTRLFPVAHVFTVLIIAVFVLPVVVDLFKGRESNFAQILAFRRTHAAEAHKPLVRSFLYFVQFGTYNVYKLNQDFFGRYTREGAWEYLRANRFICEGWLAAFAGSLAIMATWLRRPTPPRATTLTLPVIDSTGEPLSRRRFAVWLWAFTLLAVGSTLVWGCVMNGLMLYYNAFINYGIFYVGMLAVAAVAVDYLASLASPAWTGRGLRAGLYVGLLGLGYLNADHLRVVAYANNPVDGALLASVDAALRVEGPEPRTRYLDFAGYDWVTAVTVGLEVQRQGHPFLVPKEWSLIFGPEHCLENPIYAWRLDDARMPFLVWKILPPTVAAPPGTTSWPLNPTHILVTGGAPVDPVANSEIHFGGPTGNDASYAFLGWSAPELAGLPYRWNAAPVATLGFRTQPVPQGSTVHATLDCFPFLVPGKLPAQRLEASLDGVKLGQWRRVAAQPIDLAIPAALWNARPDAVLALRFPNATTPVSLGVSGDPRPLAFGFHQITFRVDPASNQP